MSDLSNHNAEKACEYSNAQEYNTAMQRQREEMAETFGADRVRPYEPITEGEFDTLRKQAGCYVISGVTNEIYPGGVPAHRVDQYTLDPDPVQTTVQGTSSPGSNPILDAVARIPVYDLPGPELTPQQPIGIPQGPFPPQDGVDFDSGKNNGGDSNGGAPKGRPPTPTGQNGSDGVSTKVVLGAFAVVVAVGSVFFWYRRNR